MTGRKSQLLRHYTVMVDQYNTIP